MKKFKRICPKCKSKNTKKIGKEEENNLISVNLVIMYGLINPKKIILLIDTTYFGKFGLMVFKDATSKKMLYYKVVDYETNQAYKEGLQYLIDKGVIIKAIVSDGRRGLLGGFGSIPTQMCHFYQKAIIRRYITKNPKLQPNKELKDIVE